MKLLYGRRYKTIDIVKDFWILTTNHFVGIESYKTLSRNIENLYTFEKCVHNDFYGHAYQIKRYCKIKTCKSLPLSLEHGWMNVGQIWDLDKNSEFDKVMVQGHDRKATYREVCNKKVLEVGDFIQYVTPSLSLQKIEKMKRKNGKTAVIFPVHSTHHVKCSMDVKELFDSISGILEQYQTVYVCLYWRDVLEHQDELFVDVNDKIKLVTAGHIYDHNFLRRLKTIILLSDIVISNEWGSQMGQAIALNRPAYLFNQNYDIDVEEGQIGFITSEDIEKDKKEFEVFHDFITERQREIIDRRFGTDIFLTPEELKKIIFGK